jgi:hypothetical protein
MRCREEKMSIAPSYERRLRLVVHRLQRVSFPRTPLPEKAAKGKRALARNRVTAVACTRRLARADVSERQCTGSPGGAYESRHILDPCRKSFGFRVAVVCRGPDERVCWIFSPLCRLRSGREGPRLWRADTGTWHFARSDDWIWSDAAAVGLACAVRASAQSNCTFGRILVSYHIPDND